jgi:tRNA(Ile2) C34 agmatinyltransferase TiaS
MNEETKPENENPPCPVCGNPLDDKAIGVYKCNFCDDKSNTN